MQSHHTDRQFMNSAKLPLHLKLMLCGIMSLLAAFAVWPICLFERADKLADPNVVSRSLSDVAENAYLRHAPPLNSRRGIFDQYQSAFTERGHYVRWCLDGEIGDKSCAYLEQGTLYSSGFIVDCLKRPCRVSLPKADLADISPERAADTLDALLEELWGNTDTSRLTTKEGSIGLWDGDVLPSLHN